MNDKPTDMAEYLKDATFLGFTRDGRAEYFKDGRKWVVSFDRRQTQG